MYFLKFFKCLFLRERASREGAQRETQNPKQAPGLELSAQSPTRGSNSQTARSWPELKSDAQPTEPHWRPSIIRFLNSDRMTFAVFPICFYDAHYFVDFFGPSALDQCLPGVFRSEDDRLWHIYQRWCMNNLRVQAGQLISLFFSNLLRVGANPTVKRLEVGLQLLLG